MGGIFAFEWINFYVEITRRESEQLDGVSGSMVDYVNVNHGHLRTPSILHVVYIFIFFFFKYAINASKFLY